MRVCNTVLALVFEDSHGNAGAYPGFSGGGGAEKGGGVRDPPKKLTSQRSARLS